MVFTFFVSLLIFCALVVASVRFIRPTYRINAGHIIGLFEDVLAGHAREQDWLVFISVPIRYDLELEAIRLRCLAIESHLLGDASRFLFDSEGLKFVSEIKDELLALRPRPHL